MRIALALLITLVSASALNLGYLTEHNAVKELPPLSAGRPLVSIRLLLGSRRWLRGFTVEATGWLLYVLALALAPLSLVQATAAGGIGILAVMVARMTLTPLSMRERLAVGTASGGLVLLGISLAGNHRQGHDAGNLDLGLWIGGSVAAACGASDAFWAEARRSGRPLASFSRRATLPRRARSKEVPMSSSWPCSRPATASGRSCSRRASSVPAR